MIKVSEKLLQFIWQFQYFNAKDLKTTTGEPIVVINKGTLNTNQGPDFLNAKIKIGNTTLAGNIELHVLSSDWHAHKHETDKNYQNIILHIVWQHDLFTQLLHQYPVATLEPLVAKTMLSTYDKLMDQHSFIPCENLIQKVSALQFQNWQERLLIERLQQKTAHVNELLARNKNNWEETFWQLIARSFGVKVNSDAFEAMAQETSNALLAKNKLSLLKIEALLMGQASLLEDEFEDAYAVMLQKEYKYLRSKYKLQPAAIHANFLRMRPAGFPTIRLSQLALLIYNSTHLFSKVLECDTYTQCMDFLQVQANDYWNYKYKFDDTVHEYSEKKLGKDMQHLIIVNTIVPALFAYGEYKNDETIKKKAMLWLEQIPAEKNNITKGFSALDIKAKTAFEAQALIQLKNNYCNSKKCLQCAVGVSLLK